jgi:protein FAM32A
MPSTDYSASSGALRLKGAAGVTKPKKKKPKKPPTDAPPKDDPPADDPATTTSKDVSKPAASEQDQQSEEKQKPEKPAVAKTAAELRYEESRRRRLEERLRREGARTHKERVEELNKYLSGLSEHHDMWVFRVVGLCDADLLAGRGSGRDKTLLSGAAGVGSTSAFGGCAEAGLRCRRRFTSTCAVCVLTCWLV